MNKAEKTSTKESLLTIKRLFSYMKEHRVTLSFVVVCIVFSAIASAAAYFFLQILIDDYIIPLISEPNPSFTELAYVLVIIALILAVGIFSAWMYNRLMVTVAQSTLRKIRDEMFTKMQNLPISYFDSHTNGEIMSLYTNDTDTLRQLIAQSLSQLVSSVCAIIAAFACMLYLSVWLTLIVLVAIFCTLQIVKRIATNSKTWFIQQQKTLSVLNGYVEEMVNGQKVVKVFGREKQNETDFYKKNKEWEKSSRYANSNANSIMPILNALGYIQYIAVAFAGAYMVVTGFANITIVGWKVLTIGTVISFLTLSRSIANPISQISSQINAIITALAGASRIFAFMDERAEDTGGYVTLVNAKKDGKQIIEVADHTGIWAWKHPHGDGSTTYTEVKGHVVFENVDFSYTGDKLVLQDISIFAEPGQKVALVGATGAGKTTITNLINRFYSINKGKIRYDGININKIKKIDLRRSLGVVLQDVNLFTGSVMENLRYGNLKATDEQCIRAAKLVNADVFIRMLPDGYDTILSGGESGLSQGQRQLLSIARAAVSDPPVMILDEATSSIDTRTETLVQDGMNKLMKGRTVFVIAHRLSTVQNADVIMVLDHGRIIERGDHDRLIAQKGLYYKLYTGSFELE